MSARTCAHDCRKPVAVVKCHKDVLGFLAMSCSIRVSDKLYQDAQLSSELQDRSIAQQIEHWARVGQATEISSNYEFDLINIKGVFHKENEPPSCVA